MLAALRCIPLETLALEHNPWGNSGVGPAHSHYRKYVVAVLGDKLRVLDGVPVTDDERASSLAAFEAEEREHPTYPGFKHLRGAWDEAHFRNTAVQGTEDDRRRRMRDEAARARKKGGPKLRDYGQDWQKMQAGEGGAGKAVGLAAAGASTLKSHGSMMFTAGGAAAVGAAGAMLAVVPRATGSLLNKTEILISFFQVYGLLQLICWELRIEFPKLWVDLSRYYHFIPDVLALDLSELFARIEVDFGMFQSAALFLASVGAYLLCFLLYYAASRLDRTAWRTKYVDRWGVYSARAWALWVCGMLLSMAVALLVDVESWDLLQEGQLMKPRSNTALVIGWAASVLLMLLWRITVGVYRKHALRDSEADFIKFWSWWKRTFQRASLFLLTVAYMPVARMTLENFAPQYDRGRLDETGCRFTDNVGRRCCLRVFVEAPCLSSPDAFVTWVHQIALLCTLLIVLGVPFFFGYLIQQGVAAVDLAGFSLQRVHFQSRIDALQQEKRQQEQQVKEASGPERAAAQEDLQRLQKTLKQVRPLHTHSAALPAHCM